MFVTELDDTRAARDKTFDLPGMRQAGKLPVGNSVDLWQVEAFQMRAFIIRKQSSPLL